MACKPNSRNANDVEALEALCLALYKVDRFADMLSVSRQGLDIDPQRVVLHHYAAHALGVRGYISEAMVHSGEAVRLMPANPIYQMQHACLELSCGNFREGWPRYNMYYTSVIARRNRVFPDFPLWNGEPVKGSQFLLVGEMGQGDQIQLLRFAEWLNSRGAIVDVMVSQSLVELATSMSSIRSVFGIFPSGPYDYWCHMMRMPEFMKLDLPMLPIVMPYVSVSPTKVESWRSRIASISQTVPRTEDRKVGVVWAGGPNSPLDRYRSINIDLLKPLLSHPGTTWFSVQKGPREGDSATLPSELRLHSLGPYIEDFTDTLAILKSLELLITVDTSVAHLAGAANLPVWVLLPAYSEWRWLGGRTDSPWYPSMRLFRQRKLGEWNPVIEEVRDALFDWCRAQEADREHI